MKYIATKKYRQIKKAMQIIAYHGSPIKNIQTLQPSPGSRYGMGPGYYFTTDQNEALAYAHNNGRVYTCKITVNNPLYVTPQVFDQLFSINPLSPDKKEFRNYAEQQGYDGLIRDDEIVAFYPHQIEILE